MNTKAVVASAAMLCLATVVQADNVINDDVIVIGDVCTGSSCADMESFGSFDTVKLSGTSIGILFNDTGGTSANDWRLQANDTNEDSFFATDVTGGTNPFKIMDTAPSNSLFIAANGDIGLGTTIPQQDLRIISYGNTEILIETTGISPIRGKCLRTPSASSSRTTPITIT